jgi:amidase
LKSDWLVERLEANGAIVMGKSNTPEFGAGGSTFNDVFGKTRNPWNLAKSVSGSSGGSAAAVASGEVWLAAGSDLGGSLRVPASFTGIVGLRPSPGRVVRGAPRLLFDPLNVEGPMARSVADAALFLDAMAGHHRADPLTFDAPQVSFADAVRDLPTRVRVCFSPNLGITPVDAEVERLCTSAVSHFAAMGWSIGNDCPEFTGAFECFQILRAGWFASAHAHHLRDHAAVLKPELAANIEKGLALSAADIARAEHNRARIYGSLVTLFDKYDLLACPTAIVPPFDVDCRYVEEVNGRRFSDYVQWTSITSAITITSCPSVSIPIGLTKDRLPVGLQIIGPPRKEALILAAAAQIEEQVDIASRLPLDPVAPCGSSQN